MNMGAQAGHERDLPIQAWRLSTQAGCGLACGSQGISWLLRRVPDCLKGLLPYCSACDGCLSVICGRLALMSYHNVFI